MNIVKGNLLDLAEQGKFDIIVQGCNCYCIMGAGIAKQIKERYPAAYDADQKTIAGDYTKLGNYTYGWSSANFGNDGFMIVNGYTQFGTSRGEDVFEYSAFKLILQKLAHEYPNKRFGFPMIGMGLAGGNKVKIMGMLGEFSEQIKSTGGDFTLVEFG
jgi:O-acetyl-ADP-ribose deacetylase (regulator of RNase III)